MIQTGDVETTTARVGDKPVKRQRFMHKLEKELKKRKRNSKFLLSVNPKYDLVEGIEDVLWIKESTHKEKEQMFWESMPSFKEFAESHYDDEMKERIEDFFGKTYDTHDEAFNALLERDIPDDKIDAVVKLIDKFILNAETGETESVNELLQESETRNEAGFTNKTPAAKLRQQKKWYRMKGNKQRLRQRKQNLLLRKKKESRDKQGRTLIKGVKKRKNRRSDNHTNETLPSDTKIKVDRKKVAQRIDEMIPTTRYKVIKSFILDHNNESNIGDLVTLHMGTYTLHKRSGKQIRFTVDESYINEFIKLEENITVEDFSHV